MNEIQKFVESRKLITNWNWIEEDGYKFPATGEPHIDCGMWKTRGCLNVENHRKLGYGNKIFAKQYRSSCYRPRCSVCYYWWIIRQANRSTRRIREYARCNRRQAFHIVFSIPLSDYSLSMKEWRKKLSIIMKELGMYGGAAVFHAFRKYKDENRYYFSPHFHVIGFGDIRGKIPELYEKYHWVIVYLDVRKSVFQTFCYLLSHAGIKKGQRSLIWMGELSYGKLKLEKEPETNLCPCCGVKLVAIFKDGYDKDVRPDKYFEGFVDPDGWYAVKDGEPPTDRYEYAPMGYVNEILKGLTTAN